MAKRPRLFMLVVGLVVLTGLDLAVAAPAHGESICGTGGTQASGAVYRICMPPEGEWNGELVVYAHGYVDYTQPVEIPEDQLSVDDGPSIPEIANGLGYAFATTSYSVNGLAIRQGLADVRDLVDVFSAEQGQPNRVYLAGPSEGGIVTALGVEQYPDVFDGGLSACGPVGDFRRQINYWGDVRVVFDHFFPDLIPGDATEIPLEVVEQWEAIYKPQVENALRARPLAMDQVLRVTSVPTHPVDREQNVKALVDLLWYNVFATNDGIAKLGGQPFDNRWRIYRGSDNDALLNLRVARHVADPAAVAEMNLHYQTSGNLTVPIVLLHTLGDPIIPYWHEPIYGVKVGINGNGALRTNIPVVFRYGHCNFNSVQLLLSFVLLVNRVTHTSLENPERVLWTDEQRVEYRELAASYGLEFSQVYLPLVGSGPK